MLYCTKCGSDLKGNRVRCPVCGYEVQKMKMDLSKPLTEKNEKGGQIRAQSRKGHRDPDGILHP